MDIIVIEKKIAEMEEEVKTTRNMPKMSFPRNECPSMNTQQQQSRKIIFDA